MAQADYRLMTEATGQRIAAALEALALLDIDAIPTSGSTKAVQSGGVYDAIQQSTAKAHDIGTEESHGAAYVAGDTFSLPGFSSLGINDLIVILARRWGYVSSVCIRKGVITAGIASNVILRNATGDAATDIIKLNISSSGVVTIVSASNGFFPEAYYIKGQ